MSHNLPLSASASPTIGDRLYKAGEMALASFSGPAAGVLGYASMYGTAILVSNWTGNYSSQPLQSLQGLLSVSGGALLTLACVATTCFGAVKGFMGKNLEHAIPLVNALKESAIIAASGAGIAAATGAAIMGFNSLSHVFQATSNPWVAGPVAAAMIVTALLSVGGSIAGPVAMSFSGLDAASKALYGCDLEGVPMDRVASKLRQARQAQAEQPAISAPRMA